MKRGSRLAGPGRLARGLLKRVTSRLSARASEMGTSVAYPVLVFCLVLTALAFFYVRANVAQREEARFSETVATAERAVDRRMDAYLDAMLSGRGLFAASNSVSREEWREYVAASDLMRRYPGMRAIAYAERVPLGGRSAHTEGVREEVPGYAVRPAGERYEFFPILYVEPTQGPAGRENRSLLGRDFFANRTGRDAMEQARDTGLPRASGKMGSGGFLVCTPVYEADAPLEDVEDRRAALQGFIVGVFEADELLGSTFGAPGEADGGVGREVDLEIFDGADLTGESMLYDSDDVLHAGDEDGVRLRGGGLGGRLSELTTMEVGGRIWSLHLTALPRFGGAWQSNMPLLVLLGGLGTSLLLFGVTWALSASRARAERFGKDLERSNRDLARANRELEDANHELEATNRELEAFSYSVSHDLRAPLRSIEGFSQILLEDYSGDLDEEGRRHLGRVRGASRHMAELIDDLLDLSRVTRANMRRTTVDLSALARQVASEVRGEFPGHGARFVAADGVLAAGDPRLLRIVLENLLGNAFKFTSRKPRARIEFGETFRGGTRAFFVRDDGAGFDMAYAGKLFGAFQRLHPSDEFEGTGIGLATVQRIVRRHGGRVWAEGKVGEGATFFFTLKP